MAQLQALNRDLICSGTATVNGVTTSFTNHIAADRGSGVSMRATGTVSGHNINTLMTGVTQTHTDAMYIWEEGQLGGMATLNFTNTAQGQAQASARAANVTYDVTCTPWTPDMSMFVPPSNIKFITTSGGSAAGASTGAGGYPAPAQTNPTSTTVGEGTDLISASNQLTALSKNLGCTIQANNSNFTSVVAILYYHPSAADVKAHIANPYATENPNMYYVQQGPPTSEETVANYYSISMVCRK
jgi:hypothetical protein